jgi:hypothetical protein
VDVETADGSVKVLVVGSGELPPRNQLETRPLPLQVGNRLDVTVINADCFTIGGGSPHNWPRNRDENIIKCATSQAAATSWRELGLAGAQQEMLWMQS